MTTPEEGHPDFIVRSRTSPTGQAIAVTLAVEVSTGALKQRIECELTAEEAESLSVSLQRTAGEIKAQAANSPA